MEVLKTSTVGLKEDTAQFQFRYELPRKEILGFPRIYKFDEKRFHKGY
ncbi:hypothetical protein [Salmonella phage SE20]|uniref:Uncharacterized protein n=2 Tax=Epseptimavirus SE24 TaxID=2846102 RepID=A0A5C0CFL5_9CAUD|nr:hypothetical protein HWC41_gp136 [Salmonella phage SE24]QEI25028.1 hypothetical protein [Salmonella phage SE24]QEI25201.1 hypothetical protein [Salmonella phage SE20]